MALTVQSVLSQVEHALGGSLSSQLEEMSLLDEAGQYLVTMHNWAWLDRPSVPLTVRKDITLTGSLLDWNNVHKHLTQSNAFIGYTYLDGDYLLVTQNTNAGSLNSAWGINQSYKIAGKQNDNQIFLDPALDTTYTLAGMTAKVKCSGVALPEDFAEVIDIQPTQGLVNSFQMVDPAFLNQLRTNEVAVGNFRMFGAIVRGESIRKMKGPGSYRLELYPTPEANERNKLTLFYRAGWKTLAGSENTYIPVPDYCESLYKQLVRTFAKGYEEDDVASLHMRLAELEQSPLLRHAKMRDGGMQNTLGQMAGGAVQQQERAYTQYLKSSVLGPS